MQLLLQEYLAHLLGTQALTIQGNQAFSLEEPQWLLFKAYAQYSLQTLRTCRVEDAQLLQQQAAPEEFLLKSF